MPNTFGNFAIPCPNPNPTAGTYLYSTCEFSPANGFDTSHDYYADGNGGEYSVDTGAACGI